jgi:hypothetical protein
MEIINYIFYISCLRFKKEDSTIFKAVSYVSFLEYMFFFGVIFLINAIFCPKILFFKYLFNNSLETMRLCVLIFYLILFLVNYFYYKGKVIKIEEKYKNYRKMKAWMFFVFNVLIISLAIIIFKIRNNTRI